MTRHIVLSSIYLLAICLSLGCGSNKNATTENNQTPYVNPLDTEIVAEFIYTQKPKKDTRPRVRVGDVAFIYEDSEKVAYRKRDRNEPSIRTLNEIGSKAARVLGLLLERDYYTIPCIPFDQEVNDLIRLKEAGKAGAFKIVSGIVRITNPDEILKKLAIDEWVTVRASMLIEEVQEYDILTSIKKGTPQYLPKKRVDKSITFAYQWHNDYNMGEMLIKNSVIQEPESQGVTLVPIDLDLFPCLLVLYENPNILAELENPKNEYQKKCTKSGDIYGFNIVKELRQVRKHHRLI